MRLVAGAELRLPCEVMVAATFGLLLGCLSADRTVVAGGAQGRGSRMWPSSCVIECRRLGSIDGL